MALRSVLAKLPKTCKYGRLIIGTYQDIKHAPRPFRVHEDPLTHRNKTQGWIYHMELGGLGPARFAVEQFNKQKKSQLQFVRVIKFLRVDKSCSMEDYRRWDLDSCHCLYALILEATDAAGVFKPYEACVRLHDLTEGLWLDELSVISDNKNDWKSTRLYHHLDNFYAGLYDDRVGEGEGTA